ncbi:hypothetical protein [Pseudorhodobacter aquimaris]|uniref:hypothetical protein n=1 Tax=Pseudorhodobacter aquimaris TaxID=687412 RepID=UPI00067B3FEC|nr:hypothetical protein [Pseudorhodobacter aquimaris]
MVKLSDIDLNEVKEFYCHGGEEGYRTVTVERTIKVLTQNYDRGNSKAPITSINLFLEEGGAVIRHNGQLVVVETGEILAPYRACMMDKSVVVVDAN